MSYHYPPTKPPSKHEASTEQASRTNVIGQCEVLAKCERVQSNHQTRRRERLGPTRSWKKRSMGNIMTLRSFWKLKRRRKPKISLPYLFALRRRGLGRSRTKMKGNFWVCPREVSSAAEAHRSASPRARRVVDQSLRSTSLTTSRDCSKIGSCKGENVPAKQ